MLEEVSVRLEMLVDLLELPPQDLVDLRLGHAARHLLLVDQRGMVVAQEDLLPVADAAAGRQSHLRRFVPRREAAGPGDHAELGVAGIVEVPAFLTYTVLPSALVTRSGRPRGGRD